MASDYQRITFWDHRGDNYYALPEGLNIDDIWVPDDEGNDTDELRDGVIDLETNDLDEAQRKLALMFHDDEWRSVPTLQYGFVYGWGSREWLVVTDDEADDLWDEDLENFIDECVLHELPERYQCYFDREKFKNDCKIDGRAHSLGRYDGSEWEEGVDGITFYIYRLW